MSLSTTPALRIKKEPSVKTRISCQGGIPRAARVRDQSVGSRSSKVPVWLLSRSSRLTTAQDGFDAGGTRWLTGADSTMEATVADVLSSVNCVEQALKL